MLERLGCRDLEQLLQECVPAEILIDADPVSYTHLRAHETDS